MTQAIWNDTVIAESDSTVVVEGNHYFPADSVRWDLLQPSDRHTVCPWKGTANYYDVTVDGKTNRNAVRVVRTPTAGGGEAATAPGLLRRLFAGGRS